MLFSGIRSSCVSNRKRIAFVGSEIDAFVMQDGGMFEGDIQSCKMRPSSI